MKPVLNRIQYSSTTLVQELCVSGRAVSAVSPSAQLSTEPGPEPCPAPTSSSLLTGLTLRDL